MDLFIFKSQEELQKETTYFRAIKTKYSYFFLTRERFNKFEERSENRFDRG